jgi:hypothetical protein
MCEIPVAIADGEKIVRAIIHPFHVDRKKQRLKKDAFKSRSGTDEVSVIRGTYKDADFCKAKGREVGVASARGEYVGLAVLLARQIRDANSEVRDSRNVYCGHAHISHGIVAPPPNEPLPPDQRLALDKKLETLRNAAAFHADPDPERDGWSGPPL